MLACRRGVRRVLIVGLIGAAALAASACEEDGGVVVRDFTFRGVTAVSESRLKASLATRDSSWLPWGTRHYFDRARFDADLKRIQAFYADRGFPDARVTDLDVDMNDAEDGVRVVVTIDEGTPLRVAEVALTGFDVLDPAGVERVRGSLPLAVGQPRDRQVVLESVERGVNELRDSGYPYARVVVSEEPGPEGRDVRVVFHAEPGTLAYFGPVDIVGNQSVSAHVIQRQLTFAPGQLYRRSLVQESQRRLYRMELFQFVNVEALDPDSQSPQVWTRVTVAEADHQRLNFGIGYGTEEKARLEGEYHHLNFFGDARSAGVVARWSSLDRGVRFQFDQPYLFSPHLSLGLEGQQWYTDTPAYQSILTGGEATVTRRAGLHTALSFALSTEYTSSAVSADALTDPTLRDDLIALGLDPTTGRQDGSLNTVAVTLERSTTDNLLDATRGYLLALHVEQAGGLLPGTFNYVAVSADARHFLPIGDRLVVATRLQTASIGAADGDPTNVPFSKKYFLGGATSVRGWGRYEISPLSGSGLPIGGTSILALTAEARIGLWGSLGGVAFLDAGNVWAENWTVRPGDLRYAVGGGLRYGTPVGPVRVDLGYQINPIDGLLIEGAPQPRPWRLHFSIGQAF